MQYGHKIPPLLLGNGVQTGGSPILSTHLKDGMTLIARGNPLLSGSLFICGKSLNKQRIQNFYREEIGYSRRQSTATDGRCKYNTSCT